jgi:hypothetical protein
MSRRAEKPRPIYGFQSYNYPPGQRIFGDPQAGFEREGGGRNCLKHSRLESYIASFGIDPVSAGRESSPIPAHTRLQKKIIRLHPFHTLEQVHAQTTGYP